MAETPFNETDFSRIQDALANIEQAEELARRATAAGIEVSSQKERLKESKDALLKLKQQFFPNR